MTIFELLGGILIGFAVFGAGFWSVWRAVVQPGLRRWLHIGAVVATLICMMAVSLYLPPVGRLAGGALLFCGLSLVWGERGAERLLPLAQAVFGALLLAGAPF
ncbi:hypothetical protein [Roseobacter sp. HKCCA0434]|uniref:hypothetical protein n=1 Tax=Roseobacter sp. HKCCA0434 TaxID=3079297 RepID=UPI00290583EB|nr:hypothetical protein [Roseobacter sp. HKCCA0434]